MEQVKFQKILLATAICAIACDGEIDDAEIEELGHIVKNTTYFIGIDPVGFSKEMIDAVKNNSTDFVGNYFQKLRRTPLSPAQELLILEIIIRIIQADKRIDENEVAFLKQVRSRLNVYDEIIYQRFGEMPCLTKKAGKQYNAISVVGEIDTLANKIINATAAENKFDKFFDEMK